MTDLEFYREQCAELAKALENIRNWKDRCGVEKCTCREDAAFFALAAHRKAIEERGMG